MEMIAKQVISPFVTFLLDILSGLVVAWTTVALGREPSVVPGGDAGHNFPMAPLRRFTMDSSASS
ncbi:hypothetical protein EDF62_2334 [Leucobacter luti]|uniref:Uncharacterized protein n=1 Tax=Leucobacter luti TaxID=340320 RepID=A0A4R6RZE6_9MICO|nr:hypothetical protein EDF62_2334 [Leucobacter luti]